ncbi:MAG TPA: glycoside hydrolase family 36 protein [Chloroflexota bacterium]|nr:glycoside hydrolase family 36 protein [Chloroflexota bacterium]
MDDGSTSTHDVVGAALARWVRRVWAGETEPPVGAPGTDGWLSAALPFSFQYGGRPSAELLPTWSRQTAVRDEEGRTVLTVRLTDPTTGLVVTWEAALDKELLAVEWLLTFRNDGAADTPPVEDVRALDLVAATDYHELVVHHATGGIAAPDAFEPQQTVVPRPPSSRAPGATGKGGQTEFRLAPTGGRSSNGVLPYFNVEASWGGARGIVVGIGWSGQWEARVGRVGSRPVEPRQPDFRGPNPGQAALRGADRLRIEAGMEEVHVSLHPGEQIRSPRILLIPWADERMRGQNLLRRYLYRHAPKLNGEPPQPALFCNVGIVEPDGAAFGAGYTYEELAGLAAGLGADYLVVDAGWYAVPTDGGVPAERAWVHGVGNYSVRQDVFPGGLRPLSDAVRRAGMGFGLWFEPERAVAGTEVHREHPDWLFETPLGHGQVFDLGNAAARRWLTDTISRLIDELGVGWYRHDANANYLPVWRAADPPDRRGISEIRCVEGLYQFWRDLLDRHPGLHIDGCASGGRRMDFEALRHHHGQTHTDWLWGDPAAMQSILHGGSQWLPGIYFDSWLGTDAAPSADAAEPRYGFFSAFGGGMNLGWRMFNARAFDVELGRRWVAEYRALRHLTLGDFYPLLPHTTSESEWLASQYDRPELGEGALVAFRRRFCPVSTIHLHPRALDPDASYLVTRQSTGAREERSGRELAAGVEIRLAEAPAHEVLHYRRQPIT